MIGVGACRHGKSLERLIVAIPLLALCRYLNDASKYVVAYVEERNKKLRIHAYAGSDSWREVQSDSS